MKRFHSDDDLPELLKVSTVAHQLDVHPKTIYRAIKRQKLAATGLGDSVRIEREEFLRYRNALLAKAAQRRKPTRTRVVTVRPRAHSG